MNTTGRSDAGMCWDRPYLASSSAGIRIPNAPISLSIAAVEPEPQKSTASSSVPPTDSRITLRASSRSRVVCNPVPDDSVCVFAYRGRISVAMNSSMNASDRPDAV